MHFLLDHMAVYTKYFTSTELLQNVTVNNNTEKEEKNMKLIKPKYMISMMKLYYII